MEKEVSYICTFDNFSSEGLHCPFNGAICSDWCHKTLNSKYAANGSCADPENHPERFNKVSIGEMRVAYEEV